jgi:hypothetical protein
LDSTEVQAQEKTAVAAMLAEEHQSAQQKLKAKSQQTSQASSSGSNILDDIRASILSAKKNIPPPPPSSAAAFIEYDEQVNDAKASNADPRMKVFHSVSMLEVDSTASATASATATVTDGLRHRVFDSASGDDADFDTNSNADTAAADSTANLINSLRKSAMKGSAQASIKMRMRDSVPMQADMHAPSSLLETGHVTSISPNLPLIPDNNLDHMTASNQQKQNKNPANRQKQQRDERLDMKMKIETNASTEDNIFLQVREVMKQRQQQRQKQQQQQQRLQPDHLSMPEMPNSKANIHGQTSTQIPSKKTVESMLPPRRMQEAVFLETRTQSQSQSNSESKSKSGSSSSSSSLSSEPEGGDGAPPASSDDQYQAPHAPPSFTEWLNTGATGAGESAEMLGIDYKPDPLKHPPPPPVPPPPPPPPPPNFGNNSPLQTFRFKEKWAHHQAAEAESVMAHTQQQQKEMAALAKQAAGNPPPEYTGAKEEFSEQPRVADQKMKAEKQQLEAIKKKQDEIEKQQKAQQQLLQQQAQKSKQQQSAQQKAATQGDGFATAMPSSFIAETEQIESLQKEMYDISKQQQLYSEQKLALQKQQQLLRQQQQQPRRNRKDRSQDHDEILTMRFQKWKNN